MTPRVLAREMTVLLGVLSRRHPLGWPVYDKSLGDVLYAVAAYLVRALLRPRWSAAAVAGLALAACLAVEGFQATGVPARSMDTWVVRWLLGTAFARHDVGCYVLGVALVAAADGRWLRPRPADGPAHTDGEHRNAGGRA